MNYRLCFQKGKGAGKRRCPAKSVNRGEKAMQEKITLTGEMVEEIEERIMREFALGRVDRAEDVPADEDCEAVFEIEAKVIGR